MADKAVTRHHRYAWIEYGSTLDGQAFAAGMKKIGWENFFSLLAAKKVKGRPYRNDFAHPFMPIKWEGNALMGRPCLRDMKTQKFAKEALFDEQRKAGETDEELAVRMKPEIQKLNEFLARWVISPGIDGSDAEGMFLAAGPSALFQADLVAVSGHGGGGGVWGGEDGCDIDQAVADAQPNRFSARLKYLLLPTCYNVNENNFECWRRWFSVPTPIRGVLGYRESYPGGETGRALFARFAANLAESARKPKPGKKALTILEAWRNAHTGKHKTIWAAAMLPGAERDTMKQWLADELPALKPSDKPLHFTDANFAKGGEAILAKDPEVDVQFHVRDPKDKDKLVQITSKNRNDPSLALFPGEPGALQLVSNKAPLKAGLGILIQFYYYREQKPGMDLDRLFRFGTPDGFTFETLKNSNPLDDPSKLADALFLTITTGGRTTYRLPFTVIGDLSHYKPDGDNLNGKFWCQTMLPVEVKPKAERKNDHTDFNLVANPDIFGVDKFYRQGVWLRARRE